MQTQYQLNLSQHTDITDTTLVIGKKIDIDIEKDTAGQIGDDGVNVTLITHLGIAPKPIRKQRPANSHTARTTHCHSTHNTTWKMAGTS
ncbi:hypothetical protein AF72_11840 [Xylella taiwanensis]|uniref:Uncharacterized protein n=1 Tax=Xylella taiwanensis TaxID=1444770 RepID=Z9JFS5_9GAMM|nr:hypothetical protein AB672_07660 [Xylella taiwanensis]EWS77260.1 hypothetical protein AF72_11840 [Xylella taiwanensis]